MEVTIRTAIAFGIEAREVRVTVYLTDRAASLKIEGLPEGTERESESRVRCAITAGGWDWLPQGIRVSINGSRIVGASVACLDLPIAVAILAARGEISRGILEDRLFVGELGLNGELCPVPGALAVAEFAHQQGFSEIIVPIGNGSEASLNGLPVLASATLREAVSLQGTRPTPGGSIPESEPDLSEIRGHHAVRRALEVAAAGAHSILLLGPPGVGKAMLARRLPGLLPALTDDEARTVTKIHSMVTDEPPTCLMTRRPYRAPHPGVSALGLAGGGRYLRPGEVTLAHGGVLFLDDLPEFRRDALEAVWRCLEEGRSTVISQGERVYFPARFLLVAASPRCPCGRWGDPTGKCKCPPKAVQAFWRRYLAPVLKYFDIVTEVLPLTERERRERQQEPSEEVARRVLAAREFRRQFETARDPEPTAQKLLDVAVERLKLTADGCAKIRRVAVTIADLDGSPAPCAAHMAEAIQYSASYHRPKPAS